MQLKPSLEPPLMWLSRECRVGYMRQQDAHLWPLCWAGCHLEASRMSWVVMPSVASRPGPGFWGASRGQVFSREEEEEPVLSALSVGRQLSARPSSRCPSGKLWASRQPSLSAHMK